MTSAAVAFALWSAQVTTGAVVTAGNFRIKLGDFSWECPARHAAGTFETLEELIIFGGETLTLKQEIRPSMSGSNLSAELSVEIGSTNTVGTWYVMKDGVQLAPESGRVSLDESLLIPAVEKVADKPWVIVMDIHLSGSAWVDSSMARLTVEDLGSLKVTAQQVRCGYGFDDPCPGGS